jgi:hypothetical protein
MDSKRIGLDLVQVHGVDSQETHFSPVTRLS